MRIWSIHPKYLDAKGIVALWRETLLAQNVLLGKTKGYKNHPQLIRFKNCSDQIGAIGFYLKCINDEAVIRGYEFNADKIKYVNNEMIIKVTDGQIKYEFKHLMNKLQIRDTEKYNLNKTVKRIGAHPMFVVVKGDVESWEKRND